MKSVWNTIYNWREFWLWPFIAFANIFVLCCVAYLFSGGRWPQESLDVTVGIGISFWLVILGITGVSIFKECVDHYWSKSELSGLSDARFSTVIWSGVVLKLGVFIAIIWALLGGTAKGGMVNLPPPPTLTPAGYQLILSFEGFDARPAWPQGASGITIGWGYDCGYYSTAVIRSDWHELSTNYRDRLSEVSGITGIRARNRVDELHDILIDRGIGTRVFNNVDVAREFANARRAMPGFDALRANAQAALISNGFNRGWGFAGANRSEMRDIRDVGVPQRDYQRIADDLRKSERIWRGTVDGRGLIRRREAEASLVLQP